MYWIRDYADRRWHLRVNGVLSCDGRRPRSMAWIRGSPLGLPSKCAACLADMLGVSRELTLYQLGPMLKSWASRRGPGQRAQPEYTVWYASWRNSRKRGRLRW